MKAYYYIKAPQYSSRRMLFEEINSFENTFEIIKEGLEKTKDSMNSGKDKMINVDIEFGIYVREDDE